MQDVYKLIGKVAGSSVPVLIQGETGTGKELVARAIHSNSPRRSRPFVAMNCTALNENLLDDELFGHEPRAFTGAGDKLRKGRFEYANGGTLFLDEIGDMPPPLQAKLLRVLENSEVVRIGGNEPIKVNVRVVSATHRDLEAGVAGRTVPPGPDLPPQRRDDPPAAAAAAGSGGPEAAGLHFLQQAAQRAKRPVPTLHEAAWTKLLEYAWPGNIRELQNVMRRAFLVCRGSQIAPQDVGLEAGDAASPAARGPWRPGGEHRQRGPRRRWPRATATSLSGCTTCSTWSCSGKPSPSRAATRSRPPAAWASPATACGPRCRRWGWNSHSSTKLEARSTKQTPMFQGGMFQTRVVSVSVIYLRFVLRACFGFRASCFEFRTANHSHSPCSMLAQIPRSPSDPALAEPLL